MWQDVLVTAVRALSNDTGSPPNFSDDRIIESLLISALVVSAEYSSAITYTVDLNGKDITPDPIDQNDVPFTTLIILKAACILTINAYTGAAGNGISIRDGDSQIDLSKAFKGYADIILLGPCKSYQNLLKHLQQQKAMSGGKAIASPGLSHPSFSWSYIYGSLPYAFNFVGRG